MGGFLEFFSSYYYYSCLQCSPINEEIFDFFKDISISTMLSSPDGAHFNQRFPVLVLGLKSESVIKLIQTVLIPESWFINVFIQTRD